MEQVVNQKIRKLYTNNLSAKEIANKLRISMRQVYSSLISQNIPRRSTTLQNRLRFENSPLSFKFKTNLSIVEKELLVAAVMLYSGEGAKTGNTVDFANSNLNTLKVFLAFLRKICQVDENRLRFYLYCFSDQDPKALINYWSTNLRARKKSFTKPYVRSNQGKGLRTMSYGVLHVRYSDKRLLDRILNLSQEIADKLTN